MNWACPNQMKDDSCSLRKKECKPGSKGCVLTRKYRFVGEGDESEPPAAKDEVTGKKGE